MALDSVREDGDFQKIYKNIYVLISNGNELGAYVARKASIRWLLLGWPTQGNINRFSIRRNYRFD